MTEAEDRVSLGFARGTAPGKWAERWHEATGSALNLVPLDIAYGSAPSAAPVPDMILERTLPSNRPDGTVNPNRARHSIALYTEKLALVVPSTHELAKSARADRDDLALVQFLDHEHHAHEWPPAAPWDDPTWRPDTVEAALALVATGAGAILLPIPLARHLTRKGEHAVLPLEPEDALPGTTVWATWEISRDGEDMQLLAGILRGRTSRSSRGAN